MLSTNLPDHRHRTDPDLLDGVRAGDGLALAEAYRRTVDAAYACARRLLASPTEVEALLRAVYTELWESAPSDEALEGWVRRRCFALAVSHLEGTDRAPASPSLAAHVSGHRYVGVGETDAVERALAGLDPAERDALLASHDRGIPTSEQDDPDATAALGRALVALADGAETAPSPGADQRLLADHALGLLRPAQAAQVAESLVGDRAGNALLRTYRRGRRRLEGLPPTADMGHRVIAAVLSAATSAPTRPRLAPPKPSPAPPEPAASIEQSSPEPAAPIEQAPSETVGPSEHITQESAEAVADTPVADTPAPLPEPGRPGEQPSASSSDELAGGWFSHGPSTQDVAGTEPDGGDNADAKAHDDELTEGEASSQVSGEPTREGWTGEEPSSFFGDPVETAPDRDGVASPLRIDSRREEPRRPLVANAPGGTGSRLLRWFAFLVLLGLGVLVGVQVGQLLVG